MAAWPRVLIRFWRARVRHTARVYYLDMALPSPQPSPQTAPPLWPAGVQIKRLDEPQTWFYRRLYDEVGRRWHWVSRRYWSDRRLAAEIAPPDTEIFVLWRKARAIGFVEMNWRARPEVEFVFLGLIPAEIGSGLGAALLAFALTHATRQGARKARIQTCSLDHARALPLYQKLGFRLRREETHHIWDET